MQPVKIKPPKILTVAVALDAVMVVNPCLCAAEAKVGYVQVLEKQGWCDLCRDVHDYNFCPWDVLEAKARMTDGE